MKIKMISLGCSKNLVDSEMVLGIFPKNSICDDIDNADIVIINTCGFIESAKKESIDTILEIASSKKTIVIGCLVERYYEDLIKEMPEVFLYIRIKDYKNIQQLINDKLQIKLEKNFCESNRHLLTPNHLAYVKIAEGCNNRCSYCAIPLIRGAFRSRKEIDIINEVNDLLKKGIKEIVLISQDTTNYGKDINTNLVGLLKSLIMIPNIRFIRLLYLYPTNISFDLVNLIKINNKIMPYFDIPIQHASDRILQLMNRVGNASDIKKTIDYIRKEIPNAVIRTTIIVGFPTESDDDFLILKNFIMDNRFDRLGVFKYSQEEDTKAYDLAAVSTDAINQRYTDILYTQEEISYELGLARIGQIHEAIIEEVNKDYYLGRSYAFAPDDVDGYLFIKKNNKNKVGDIVSVNITDADSYNLYGDELIIK